MKILTRIRGLTLTLTAEARNRVHPLGVAAAGFIVALLGAGSAVGSAYIRDQIFEEHLLAALLQLVVWIGYVVMFAGAILMAIGLVFNLLAALSRKD